MSESTKIGMDLAKTAGDRASQTMLDALSICETPQQAAMVAITVLSIVAAQACGAINASLGVKIDDKDAPEMLEQIAQMMRSARRAAQ